MRKKVPKNIKKMLDSEDIELVQLGAVLMREYVPRERWDSVLEMFSFKESQFNNVTDIYIKKWDWKIEGNDITITECSLPGVGNIMFKFRFKEHDTYENWDNPGKSKGYVGKPRLGNGKAGRVNTPRIRKK